MRFLRTLAPWLLVACLAQQLSTSVGMRERGRRGRGEGKGEGRGEGRAEQSPGASRSGKSVATSGQFTTKDKFKCKWAARKDNDAVNLGVSCQNPEARYTGGVTSFKCEYNAKPSTCPGYSSNPGGFWKQVARALKKMEKKLCRDNRALVRSAICKRAPRDAHFQLDMKTAVTSAQSPDVRPPLVPASSTTTTTTATTTSTTTTTTTLESTSTSKNCTDRADQRRLAEEYCNSSWASLCTFFFAMIQSGEC